MQVTNPKQNKNKRIDWTTINVWHIKPVLKLTIKKGVGLSIIIIQIETSYLSAMVTEYGQNIMCKTWLCISGTERLYENRIWFYGVLHSARSARHREKQRK